MIFSLNTEATCLLSVWQASFRRRDLYLGLIMELGNLNIDASLLLMLPLEDSQTNKGKCTMRTTQSQNTNAIFRGRLIRSSDDTTVMEE